MVSCVNTTYRHLNPLLNNSLMILSLAHYSPGSQFIRGVYKSPVPAQVPAFTAGELQHARRNDILRGIVIAVVSRPALWTNPSAHRQCQPFQSMPATRARLGTRKPPIHRDHSPAIPTGLIFNHAAELSEACVGDMPCQRRVLNHVFDLQIFDADHIELARKPSGERVQSVGALVCNLAVDARDAPPLTFTALRSFLPASQAPLLLLEVLEPSGELARVLDLGAVGERRQVREAEINTDHLARGRQQRNIDRGAECDVVAPVGFALERNGIWASNAGQIFGELHCAELRQTDYSFRPLGEAHVLKPQAGRHAALAELRIAGNFTGLHAPEEMRERDVLIPESLRQACCGRALEPGESRELLDLGEAAGNVYARDGFFAPLVSFGARGQGPIPQPAGSAEPRIEKTNLSAIEIGANTIGSLYGGHAEIINRAAADDKSFPLAALLRNRRRGAHAGRFEPPRSAKPRLIHGVLQGITPC